MEKISRYLVVSDRTYTGPDGVRVRLAYGTRLSKPVAVDPATADGLAAGDLARVADAWLPSLREARIVVASGDDERAVVLDRNRAAAADRSGVHIALLPTRYCNMGCTYCGQEHTPGGLGGDHRGQVRERVLRAINAPRTRNVRIDWFGAEPMVGYAIIRDLAPRFVAAAAERGVGYGSCIVTNGSLLTTAKVDHLIRACGLTHFEVTIDGPPEVHDAHRPLKNGRGSFWTIADVLRAAVAEPDYRHVEFQLRTNVDVNNQDSIERYLDLMAELGFARPNVRFSIVPVHSWGNDVSQIEVTKREYAAREIAWLRRMRQHGLNTTLVPRRPATVVCPAVTRSAEIISSTGNIFSCSEHPLVPAAERDLPLVHLSRAVPGAERPIGLFDGWNDDIAAGKSWCTDCVFMPTCGGSCPKAWQEGNPPCPSYKYNIQDRLDLVAEEHDLTVAAA